MTPHAVLVNKGTLGTGRCRTRALNGNGSGRGGRSSGRCLSFRSKGDRKDEAEQRGACRDSVPGNSLRHRHLYPSEDRSKSNIGTRGNPTFHAPNPKPQIPAFWLAIWSLGFRLGFWDLGFGFWDFLECPAHSQPRDARVDGREHVAVAGAGLVVRGQDR